MSAQRNIQAIYPLTPMQHGMLFHSLLEPGSGVYVEQMSCLLAGDLDAEAFVRAWQLAIQRHEVLRAAFVWQDVPKPLQVIGREVHPEWTREDLSELSEDERRARFEDYLAVDRATGFRLGKAPLLRFALFRNSAVEHRFVWSFHHILMDGWCLPVVLGEVMRCYQSLISNQQPNLPAPPRYEEFVAWLQRQDATQAEQFWRGRLDGLHAPTPLPFTSSSTPGLEDYQQLRVSLSSVLSASLQIVARQERITLNSIFQSAWAILLARLAHTNDVTFGATVSGRPGTVKGIETMVGLFINTLPIRIAVKPEMAVCDWVRENHARMTEALQFECVPLAQIHGWSSVPRGTPLFESVLVFENFPIEQSVREGSASLYVREIKFQQQIDLPLMLTVMPGPQQIAIRLSWDNNRFSDSAMDSIVACVREILASIAAQPHSTVANIRLLDNNTRQTMLAASKAAQASWEGSSLIHKLFTQQVHRTPGNIAVKDSSTQLTYRELDEQSNSLSHQLRGLGVRRGSLVGIYMDRGAHPAVAALAILKAGAAYVPMEPGYPPDRLRWTIDDTHMRVIVTTAAHIATLDEFGVHLLPFDPAAAALRTGPPSVEPLDEHDAAYVIYTSGSTGKPKGVVVEHGSVTNYLRALIRATDLQPDFSWAMVQPLSVDASVTAFYPPLLSGGTLHVIAHDMALDADAVGAYLDRERVDCLKIAPSHLAALQRSTNKYAVMPRRRLILGGEGSDREWALSLLDRQPGCGIWNHYGPTEATVGMLTCEVERDKEELSSTTIPLGRPLSNTQAYLLDQEMEPLPTGSAGELYIGGACLARGYLNRPDLTAASFLPDPFGAHGGRLYRTGDLARFLPNDNLVFLGRKDQQVKIRGYRIELAEIEAALRAYPGIAEAVVDARQIASDDQRLVAYFVASVEPIPSTAPASGDLRRWLKDRLPDHMIPGVFMPLNALPRNAHGKLDRNALPPPTWGELDLTGSTEPSSEAEKILVQIWSEVLRVQHVSVHQNFFELGGDSILSIQIVARAQTQGLRITVKQLFQHQTIAELAAVAEYCTTDSESTQTPVSGPVELTPIQQWFFERNWKEPWHFNQSVLLESREPVNLDGLRAAVAALVFHHDALRTRFQLDQTGWAQEVTNTALDALVMEQVASAVELEERAAHWQKQFDLASGLLLRVVLFRMSPAEADRVLLIAHHLVVDGVSWRVLLEDLERGYSQWRQEQKIELPAKTASFQRWAAHLKQQAASPAVEAEWPYWEQQCTASDTHDRAIPSRDREGAVASLERQPEQIATVSLHLNEEDTRALLQEVPPVYGTRINDVLLTALNEALGTDGQLTVELEGHGREEIAGLNITRTVGWFTVHYPIRLDTRHNEDIADKLKSIKEQLRAVPGGGLGYGLLRYWGADPERRKSLQHSATVSFNYLGQLDSMLPREGLFQAAQESKGSTQSASLTLTHDFIVTANV
ncbi:MAG: amino acid adenylation domain-containing protein, partial [Bryobacteraceae bacterium]